MFSKETIDKVKVAKQYIQSIFTAISIGRYQNILSQEKKNQQNWNKILSLVSKTHEDVNNVAKQINNKQAHNKRLLRQKDSLENYRLYNMIGKGAFGQVRLARNLVTNEVVVIKRLQKSYLLHKKQVYNAYLERDFMIKNKSHFIVQMKSTFQDQDYLYIVMEYIQGGDLLHLLIQRDLLSEDDTKFYVAELVLAVEQIHRMNYIHRDIKPDNILLDKSGHIKIADFGLSKYLELEGLMRKQNVRLTKMEKLRKLSYIKNKQRIFSKVGTPDYISPEVLTEKVYDHGVDIWGIGVIMFQCLYGFPPFTDEDSKEVCHRVANWVDYLQFPDSIKVSTSAKMLMLGLMNQRQKRLTIGQIKLHPFFAGVQWETHHLKQPPIIPKIKDDLDSSNFDRFQIINPWTNIQKQLVLHFSTPKQKKHNSKTSSQEQDLLEETSSHSRKSTGKKFCFAGFNYRRIDSDPFETTAERLLAKRYSHSKPSHKTSHAFSKGSSKKHLKTEQESLKFLKSEKNHRNSIKKSLKSKKSIQKTRPSQLLSTTNNISINVGRFDSSKDLSKAILNRKTSKQNQGQKFTLIQKASSKIKLTYNPLTQNLKAKKVDYLQAQCKTHA